MIELSTKKCVPCEGDTQPLTHDEAQEMLKQVNDWELHEVAPSEIKGRESYFQKVAPFGRVNEVASLRLGLEREFKFKNFKEAVAFVNKVAELAESEGHHPNIFLHSWNKVRLTLYTHAIGGLSENDFIMAAKVNFL